MLRNRMRRVCYQDQMYTIEELQRRLLSEVDRLQQQLDQLGGYKPGTREVLASTYHRMITKRVELYRSL